MQYKILIKPENRVYIEDYFLFPYEKARVKLGNRRRKNLQRISIELTLCMRNGVSRCLKSL